VEAITVQELTIKQEKFCRAYVSTAEGNASEAYRTAYNTENMKNATINRRATELTQHGMIKARIDQLKAEYSDQEAITVEEISGALRRALDGAAAAGQWSAASQAALGLAKLGGLLIEKRQITADDGAKHLDAVAALAGVPRKSDEDDNVVDLKQAACN
jgi:hypothetical protein